MNKPDNIYAPKLSPAAVTPAKKSAFSRESLFTADFFLCFISFEMLLLSFSVGTWGIIGFILPWTIVWMRRPAAIQRVLLNNWQLLIFPSLAMISAMWSYDHMWTLRAGTQLMLTVIIGMTAAGCLKPRIWVAAFLFAFVVAAILSVLSGHTDVVGTTGEIAWVGIFGSKNAFSAMMSLLMLASMAVWLDKEQGKFLRFIALGGLAFTPLLLYHGRSLGAVLSVYMTIALFFAIRALKSLKPTIRNIMYVGIFVVAIVGMLFIYLAEINPMSVLNLVGKDSTLTGRTHMWSRAIDFISERPFLGVGYRTFWRIGNPGAEELWYYEHVAPGSGFNFHNEYIEMTVQMGLLGLAALITYLVLLVKRGFRIAMQPKMSVGENFAFLILIFDLIRTPVEAGLFHQFDFGILLVCLMWVYFRPAPRIVAPFSLQGDQPKGLLQSQAATQ